MQPDTNDISANDFDAFANQIARMIGAGHKKILVGSATGYRFDKVVAKALASLEGRILVAATGGCLDQVRDSLIEAGIKVGGIGSNARAVVTTFVGATSMSVDPTDFDIVVLDERSDAHQGFARQAAEKFVQCTVMEIIRSSRYTAISPDAIVGAQASWTATVANADAFVIRSASEQGFWSNDDGWVDLDSATRFTETDTGLLNLPLSAGNDASWVGESEASPIACPTP
jgi:hypothetical protein